MPRGEPLARREEATGHRPGRLGVSRRTLLAGALGAVGAAVAGDLAGCGGKARPRGAGGPPAAPGRARAQRPNILVVIVDQMRQPRWFPAGPSLARQLPSITRLRRESVAFERHFTASNDCTPARATLLTGLYTHQTGCMITGRSTLDAGFPTYGTMLRDAGYHTAWFGKWHLTNGDSRWLDPDGGELEAYGFGGGTYPSPDGAPGQGHRVDPYISRQFAEWFSDNAENGPWCTTVSFVNPHDIAWWYRYTDLVPAESFAASAIDRLPANFETPEQLMAARKPRLQLALQDTSAAAFGPVDFRGPAAREQWLSFLNLYLRLQSFVDTQIGNVLDTLDSHPEVARNTIVIFTSDHGEYGGSHGLRGKGAGAYDEAIAVPLTVKDPRGRWVRDPGGSRQGLTSSVDVAPLLLTLATGGDGWRADARHAHLADRADLARMLVDPRAPGRRFVLHATDEIATEFAPNPYDATAPLHVTAVRTARAKYATYSNWSSGTIAVEPGDQDAELYEYASPTGRHELDNLAGRSPREGHVQGLLAAAVAGELRRPLPARLRDAQRRGFADYFKVLTATPLEALRNRRPRPLELRARPVQVGQPRPLGITPQPPLQLRGRRRMGAGNPLAPQPPLPAARPPFVPQAARPPVVPQAARIKRAGKTPSRVTRHRSGRR